MARGGARQGAGRKKGGKNRRTKERERAVREAQQKAEQALGAKVFEGDAHALLCLVYKDTEQPISIRLDAAKAAIGYEKPRLSTIDASLDGTFNCYEPLRIPVEMRNSDAAVASAD